MKFLFLNTKNTNEGCAQHILYRHDHVIISWVFWITVFTILEGFSDGYRSCDGTAGKAEDAQGWTHSTYASKNN